jgi:hypothetical protein
MKVQKTVVCKRKAPVLRGDVEVSIFLGQDKECQNVVGMFLSTIPSYFNLPPHMFARVEVRMRLCDVRMRILPAI